jgi:hypothetical protein
MTSPLHLNSDDALCAAAVSDKRPTAPAVSPFFCGGSTRAPSTFLRTFMQPRKRDWTRAGRHEASGGLRPKIPWGDGLSSLWVPQPELAAQQQPRAARVGLDMQSLLPGRRMVGDDKGGEVRAT